jgi:hypothetical protein
VRRHDIGIDIDISWIRTSIDGKYELKSKNFADVKDVVNGVQRFNLGGRGLQRSVSGELRLATTSFGQLWLATASCSPLRPTASYLWLATACCSLAELAELGCRWPRPGCC